MSDEKLSRIETALAHHDLQIQDLSEMINLQWKEIERLKRLLEETRDKIGEMGTGNDKAETMSVSEVAASEKPPHY